MELGRGRADDLVDGWQTSLEFSPRVGLCRDTALLTGIQTALAALMVVSLNNLFVLTESAWAVTACVYVITVTPQGTLERARHRIVGTLVGVPLGLACMPVAAQAVTKTRTRMNPLDRKQELVEATIDVLATKGYSGFTLAEALAVLAVVS